MFPGPTIVDVLDNVLGGTDPALADSMTQERLDDLAEFVEDFYSRWEPPIIPSDRLVAYSGGGIGLLSPGGPPNVRLLYASMLYYPHVVVHCPFGDWFTHDRSRLHSLNDQMPGVRSGQLWPQILEFAMANEYVPASIPWTEARDAIRNKLSIVHTLRPLIETGIVIPVPSWKLVRKRQHQIAAAMRRDMGDDAWFAALNGDGPEFMAPVGDWLTATGPITTDMTGTQVRWQRTQPASFYLNKLLAVSGEAQAIYVPASLESERLLDLRTDRIARELRAKSRVEFRIVRGLEAVPLPLFGSLEPRNYIALRRDEDAFQDFRDTLSSVFRTLPIDETSPEYALELQEALRSAFHPHVRALDRLTKRTPSLREALPAAVLELGATWITGSVPAALTAALIPPALALLIRKKPEGIALAIQALRLQ